VIEEEISRRTAQGAPKALRHEVEGTMPLGTFTLKGRADRIELSAAGTVSIIDYKTGTVPNAKSVKNGAAPQLPLEAVMAEAGAFGEEFRATVAELAYFKLSGRAEAGDETRPFKTDADIADAVAQAGAALPKLFAKFARAETPYLARPHPSRPNQYDAYAGISRRAEWEDEPE